MKRMRVHGVRIALFGIVAVGVAGVVTTGLWNALMPSIFNLPAISFWQALGLLILSRLLFGRFGGPRRKGMGRGRFVWRQEHLTPEERERFRQAMGRRCGGEDDAPAAVRM